MKRSASTTVAGKAAPTEADVLVNDDADCEPTAPIIVVVVVVADDDDDDDVGVEGAADAVADRLSFFAGA